MLNLRMVIGNLEDCLTVMSHSISAQCKVVIRASVIAAIYGIWRAHNFARFQDTRIR